MKKLLLLVMLTGCLNGGNEVFPPDTGLPPLPSPSDSPKPQPSAQPSPTPKPPEPSPTETPISSPTPAPTPDKCPCLVSWNIGQKPLNLMNRLHQPVSDFEVDGFAIYDTTAKFAKFVGDQRGLACDHFTDGSCWERGCDDPRGPEFSFSGPSRFQVNPGNEFQAKVGPLVRGTHYIRASPRKDLQDALGQPVSLCPWVQDPSRETEFSF